MITHRYIDTHTHLDDKQYINDLDAVLTDAMAAGVSGMVNIGYCPERWTTTLALAERYPRVSYALGLHPGNADEWSESLMDDLTSLLERVDPVAVGEIGLDYYWTQENKAVQRMSFERQLELAHSRSLPIIIHQRDAAADVAAILRNAPADLRVVLHSFDGDPELSDLARERGWMIGVGGLMTRRQSEALRSGLPGFPLEQMLLETDSPYLVPSGVKARRNVPAMIPLIAERLAGVINRTVDDIAQLTTRNAERIFGLKATATAP
ncbi:MAG TPA: TatD family hydrolase [Thermomicrobiales bacterium]|nr:TatD family hydrolase [Thermomicrobiales bacterium]